jgi:2,4-dienoyl-CoA reductase-like NADH-dependent reductase (Old Yellow Enzyme family)
MSSSSPIDPLFSPWTIGNLQLKHRIVMAPLTRNRATEGTLAPNDLLAENYEQRASDGGLLITEVSDSLYMIMELNGLGHISVC